MSEFAVLSAVHGSDFRFEHGGWGLAPAAKDLVSLDQAISEAFYWESHADCINGIALVFHAPTCTILNIHSPKIGSITRDQDIYVRFLKAAMENLVKRGYDQIRLNAYYRWERAGCPEGLDLMFWDLALREERKDWFEAREKLRVWALKRDKEKTKRLDPAYLY